VRKRIRYHLSVWLFDLAAKVYPNPKRGVAQCHHVSRRRWLRWELREVQ
jgi:hypothetical protein